MALYSLSIGGWLIAPAKSEPTSDAELMPTVPNDWQLMEVANMVGYWSLGKPEKPVWSALAKLHWDCLAASAKHPSNTRLCRFQQRWWLWTELQGQWWLRLLPSRPAELQAMSRLAGLRGISIQQWRQNGFSYVLFWLPRSAPTQVARYIQMRWQQRLKASPLQPKAQVLQFHLQRPPGVLQIFAAPLAGQQGSLVMLWQQQNH